VLAAAAVAGLGRVHHLGIDGSPSLTAAAHALWRALAAHPELVREALVLGAAAAALPSLRRRGPWPAAGFGAVFLAAVLLPNPTLAALPLVVAVWVTCIGLALETGS
jgi:hypothetical protein